MDKKVGSSSKQVQQLAPIIASMENPNESVTSRENHLKDTFINAGVEFSSKIKENFKCYLFISASSGRQSLDEIVENMAYFANYQKHKYVGCSKRIYHLYVKYESESIALTARDFFRMRHLHAELVYDMLHLWYAFEKHINTKCPTIGWMTISDDSYPNSASADVVLQQYGNPQIIAVEDKRVKLSFNSIAEAFAACIALGQWYYTLSPVNTKYYSVQIELSEHCSKIVRLCNMTSIAREFDYFVQYDPSNASKMKYYKSLPPNEFEPEQKIRVIQSNLRRPFRNGLRNRNYNKTYGMHHDNVSTSR